VEDLEPTGEPIGPAGVDKETAREMVKLGASQEQADAARRNFERPIAVHPLNWEAVQVFRLCTIPSVGTWNGLASVQVSAVEIAQAAAVYGAAVTAALVHSVRYIAFEYCRTQNEKLGRK
jgi:hypothetical protein